MKRVGNKVLVRAVELLDESLRYLELDAAPSVPEALLADAEALRAMRGMAHQELLRRRALSKASKERCRSARLLEAYAEGRRMADDRDLMEAQQSRVEYDAQQPLPFTGGDVRADDYVETEPPYGKRFARHVGN